MVNAIFFTHPRLFGINGRMRWACLILFFLPVLAAGAAGLEPTPAIWAERKGKSTYQPKPGERLFICQPNGWGYTPEQAIRDVDRVMKLYEKEPGYVRHRYIAIIKMSKHLYQADARCTYYARPALTHRGTGGANTFMKK